MWSCQSATSHPTAPTQPPNMLRLRQTGCTGDTCTGRRARRCAIVRRRRAGTNDSARAKLDALAAACALVESQSVVSAGSHLLQARVAVRVAEHPAPFAAEAQP